MALSAAPVGEPSEKDGSFSVPAEQPTRHFTDAEVRRNYEYILTSTNLYPPELHSAVRSVLSEPPLNPDWSDKGRQIAALFTPYGDREYQGDLLYRTRLHGEDGISFFFDEGYTYIPWNGLAFLLDAMIEDGDYPNPVAEEQPDPIGDYNIPDEVDEMGGPHRQMTIGEADFDYVLDSVAYEAGETVVEPVKPPAIVQMENDTPAAGDEPASVPDENPHAIVEAPETALPTDTAEQPAPPPVKGNTTAHKNFRRFQELFPEIVSGQYEYLRLEAGEAYYPLVIHHKYGSHYCMEHYYILSPQEAADMDDLEDTQYRLEKELEELRPIRAFVRMGDGTAAEAPAVMDEATPTDLAPLREPPAAPQVAAHNFRFSEDYDLYPSGAKTKYKNNVMAIKLLKQIELEKRTATPEEQIILARYVGWGGLANAFSSTASGWENEYQELKSLLTDVEYKAAMNSTITAYYTEPDLIRHIYRALERFGFEGGPDRKILDPGMGTGNFYSVLPEQFQGSKLFGVELDSITGRIAKQLYPDADISIMGYEATKFEDNSFDVILGNIPFNSVKIYDRRY
ncbi:class I SAM-dependent methyltransferase, partial [Flavonifractor sp. An91]|uniref:methyltransferase domain-containing protein n=1 Tax=Flavonifractor sp. An91 TaxID=1965665 RepID=UPI000B56C226